MVTVSVPPPHLPNPSMREVEDEVDIGKMDGLLEELKTSMVELILQGDDVTHQMWRMYSVFEEIFGRQTMTTSSNQPLKHVVVGDRLKGSPPPPKGSSSSRAPATPTSPLASSTLTKAAAPTSPTATAVPTTTSSAPGQLSSPTPVCSTPKDVKEASPEEDHSSASPQNKVPKYAPAQPSQSPSPKSSVPPSDRSSSSIQSGQLKLRSPQDSPSSLNPTSNPLLDTIGALANSNQDSDDSDLDMVYQQLRYRGRQRKQEQMRMRTHRTHRHQHHQVASSDPESIGYAGSNSIDSGYKSLCATPEVSDSLSAPEVRRSASDVSASDSSTTSGRPRSLDGGGQDAGGKSGKIKMGTRSAAGKLKPMSPRQVPATSAMNDVTLDHLMYLRQSLRKDRPDAQRSPNDSIPSSATSSTFRDSDLSPRPLTDEEWRDSSSRSPASSSRSPAYPLRQTTSSSPDTFARSCSSPRGSTSVDQEGGGESSSDFLLSGVEYYDLESIQEFPPANNYVTMVEEKTRCARFQVVQAPRSSEPLTERQLSSLYRKRSDSTQSVDGDVSRRHPLHSQQQNIYGLAGSHHHRSAARNSAKALASRHHHHRQHHATDSKLTEAAIRVLEMIEDFRMEEAITRSGRVLQPPPPEYHHLQGPSHHPSEVPHHHQHHQTILPRSYRKSANRRPASTGSLMEHEIDARSVASSSAEHHVYEEIMYDLVCERGFEQRGPPPIPPGRIVGSRARLLPVPPQAYAPCVDPRRIMVRSHKHSSSRSSNMYSVVHGRGNVDRFLEMEWQERRDSLPPDFPV